MGARRLGQHFLTSFLRNQPCQSVITRNLYSEEHLGIPNFRRQRMLANERFGETMKGQYIERLKEAIQESSQPVFSDDIKTLITLAESKADIDLLVEMLRKYQKQSNELKPDFRFGPLVMRALTLTNQVDLALQLYKDNDLKQLFDQFTSVWLLLDLLYEDARCFDAVAIYEEFCQRHQETTIPAALTTLALASCYKMASDESFT